MSMCAALVPDAQSVKVRSWRNENRKARERLQEARETGLAGPVSERISWGGITALLVAQLDVRIAQIRRW